MKRGNTFLDTKTDDIKFDLFFGCAPSIGVKADTKFIADVCEALLDRVADDMTLTFPEFLEGIKGTDTNFELVSSSTTRPVKLIYTFNLVSKLLGYVFAWDYLKGLGDWEGHLDGKNGEVHSATEIGKIAQKLMMDPEALAIPDVQLIVNSTKAEVIDYFKTINQKVEKTIRDEGCRVGVFLLSIGF